MAASKATKSAAVGGTYKNSPFKLRCNITDRGVFFDRLDGETGKRALMIQTTPKKARRLALWILKNTEPQHTEVEDFETLMSRFGASFPQEEG